MKKITRLFVLTGMLLLSVAASAQMQFSFSNLSGVVSKTLNDGTELVQLPAGTDLSQMSSYGMSVTVDGTAAILSDIVPNPSKLSYNDGALYSFYYKGKSYQARFAAGEYFTAVFFSDAQLGGLNQGITSDQLTAYANEITQMGKSGGQHFSFDALPGYDPQADIAFYLGDMAASSSPTPVIHTLSYNEGMNVVSKAAVVSGQFETLGTNSTVTEYGLCLSTTANPTISDTHKAAADYGVSGSTMEGLEGVFGVYFDDLTASTTYHVRAYCTYTYNGSSATTYGEDQTLTTTGGSGFTWSWEGGETPSDEVKARIEEAMDGAKYYYQNYCNLYKWCGTSYNSGVATADCSLRSDGSCYIRFGPYERYQWVGTAQHEISHGYGVGQTSAFAGYPSPWTGKIATLTLCVFLQDMTMRIYHDSQHYWPGGINQREEVTNGTSNNQGTYTCKDEEMLKANAMLLNGWARDGMQTTYGAKERGNELSDAWKGVTTRHFYTSTTPATATHATTAETPASLKGSRNSLKSVSGQTGFETALDGFRTAGIPLIVNAGELDQANGATGNTADGYSVNSAAYDVVTRALTEAQNYGVEDVNRFSATSLTNTIQAQPYAFRFKGVRFYNGLKQWFDKPLNQNGTTYRWIVPDNAISALSTYVSNHQDETSIWMQHLPFSADDYLWLDKGSSSDATPTTYSATSRTTTATGNYATAAARRSALVSLINQTAHAAHFSGHGGAYAENSANGFTDYTLDGIGNTPGDALIVLMKAGTGVVEVKRVDFRNKGTIAFDDEAGQDIPTSSINQKCAILGGLVSAMESLNSGNAAITSAISTARNAKSADAVSSSVTALNDAFNSYVSAQNAEVDVTGLLGSNTNFQTAIGSQINSSVGNLYAIPGWNELYNTNQSVWGSAQYKTDQESPVSGNSLYLRENWKGSPSVPSQIQVYKDAVLPAGAYKLQFYMRQLYTNQTSSLNYYEINGGRTSFSAGTSWEQKTINITLVEPAVFRLSFGFMGSTSEGNLPCQVDVDDVTLTWTPVSGEVSEGTYYLYNVAAQQFLVGANDWGTQASLAHSGIDVTLASSGEGYTIETNISNGGDYHYLSSGLYVDGAADAWTFTKTGEANGKAVYAMSADGTNYLASASGSAVLTTTSSVNAATAQWQLFTKGELISSLSQATEQNPVDATFLVSGYNFGRNDGRNANWQGDVNIGGPVANQCIEEYNKNFDVYQILTNVPNGTYQLSAQGFYRQGAYADAATLHSNGTETINAYLCANNETLALPSIFDGAGQDGTTGVSSSLGYIPDSHADASSYFTAGAYQSGDLQVTVTDNTLRIGARKTTTVGADWTAFDNFSLEYLGAPSDEIVGEDDEEESDLASFTPGVYYLYNVAMDQFMKGGNSWDTYASIAHTGIDLTFAESGGGYTIETNISNGNDNHYLASSLYLDGAATPWFFYTTGTANGKPTYAISSDGTNYLASNATTALTTVSDKTAAAAQWQLVTAAELRTTLDDASDQNPVNATFLLPGWSFSRNDGRNSSWQGSPAVGGGDANNNGEKYNTNFDVYQTLTNVPNGVYRVSAQGYYRNGTIAAASEARTADTEALNAYMYVNGQTSTLPSIFSEAGQAGNVGDNSTSFGYIPNTQTQAAAYFNAGLYPVDPIEVTVIDNTLTIGVKKTVAVANDWTCFDNFYVEYLGELSEDPYWIALAAAQEAVSSNEAQTAGAATAAVNQYEWTAAEYATKSASEITTAIAVLNNGTVISNASQDATSLLVNGDFSNATLSDNVPTGWTAYNTTATDADVWVRTQDGAQVFNFWAPSGNIPDWEFNQTVNNLPQGVYRFSIDMGTSGFDEGGAATQLAFIIGDATGASQQVNTLNTADSRAFGTYTCATELTNGNTLTVGVRSQYFYLQCKNVVLTYLGDPATSANQAETDASYLRQDYMWWGRGALEYDASRADWANAKDVVIFPTQKNQLIKAAAADQFANTTNKIVNGTCANFVITDGYPLQITTGFTATNASYERTISNDFATVFLPYPISSTTDRKFYVLSQVDGELNSLTGVMTFESVEILPAGTPGLLHHSEGGDMTFSGTNVSVSSTSSVNTETRLAEWTWSGVYESTALDATQDDAPDYYYVSGNKFYHATGTLTINPFRTYFIYTGGGAVAERFDIMLDDQEATAITGVETSSEVPMLLLTDKGGMTIVAQADLNYQVVSVNGAVVASGQLAAGESKALSVPAGVYVVNGKKVYIK